MKITIYELLGLVKAGKAPKRIKVTGTIYNFDEEFGFYFTNTKNGKVALGGKLNEINLIYNFNSENNVEILEEQKKIPKKLKSLNNVGNVPNLVEFADKQQLNNHLLKDKINSIIDYLESKGE